MSETIHGQTPDFYHYPPAPLAVASIAGTTINLRWPDGTTGQVNGTWLRENIVGLSVDPETREGISIPDEIRQHTVDSVGVPNGELQVEWQDGIAYTFNSGWLASIAAGEQSARSGLPVPIPWVTEAAAVDVPGERRASVPTFDWSSRIEDGELLTLLQDLLSYGVVRLTNGPTGVDDLENFVRRFAMLRDTNFGHVWDVRAKVDPDSTANTGRPLVPHTDLPTRERPPGFQALHCIRNSCVGGLNQMSDALAIVNHLADAEPHHHEALTTLRWTFQSKGPTVDHRWSGPIVDSDPGTGALIIRGFSPVRAFPDMPAADVDRSYAALARFHQLGADPAFQIESAFAPGDAVIFDNRRMLHARSGFDPTAGTRHLRGCYFDADEFYSTIRVMQRSSSLNKKVVSS